MFINNQHGGISLIQIKQQITIQQSQFQQNLFTPLIVLESKNIEINDCLFEGNLNQLQYGGGIYLLQLEKTIIKESIFSNNTAKRQGGGIFLKDINQCIIETTIISNNNIENFFNQDEILIDKHVQQQNQYLLNHGGGIFAQNINHFTLQSSELNENQGVFKGGGLFIKKFINIDIQQTKFNKNSVHFIKNQDRTQKNNQILSQGGGLMIEFPNINQIDGEVVHNQKQFSVNIINSQFVENIASSGAGILINYTKIQNQKQLMNEIINKIQNKYAQLTVKECKFQKNQSDLGSAIRILGFNQSEQIQNLITYSSKNQFQNNISELYTSKIPQQDVLSIYFPNEYIPINDSNQFKLCPYGYYNYLGGNELICDECPENSICPGGYANIYPIENYWRGSKEDISMVYCAGKPHLCLGNDECEKGYSGVLCENCDFEKNYRRSSNRECNQCGTSSEQHLNFILLIIAMLLFFLSVIYNINQRRYKLIYQKTLRNLWDYSVNLLGNISGILKVFVNHWQILSFTTFYGLDYPRFMATPINFFGNPQQLFNSAINCFIAIESQDDYVKVEHHTFFYGLLVIFVILILIQIIHSILYLTKVVKKKQQYLGYIYSSMMCIFQLVQPGLFYNSLRFLMCDKEGGYNYTMADSNISCSSDYFRKTIFPMHAISVVILGFVLPLILCLILLKNKSQITNNKTNFQNKFGYLYLEYKIDWFIWEVIIIFLKTCIITISGVLETSVTFKGCFSIVCIIIYLSALFQLRPYTTKPLNYYAIVSSIIHIITLVFLIIYSQLNSEFNLQDSFKLVTQFCILVMNIFFVVYSILLLIRDQKSGIKIFLMKRLHFLVPRELWQKKQLVKKRAKYRWQGIRKGFRNAISEYDEYNQLMNDNQNKSIHDKFSFNFQLFFLTELKKQYNPNMRLQIQNLSRLDSLINPLRTGKRTQTQSIQPNASQNFNNLINSQMYLGPPQHQNNRALGQLGNGIKKNFLEVKTNDSLQFSLVNLIKSEFNQNPYGKQEQIYNGDNLGVHKYDKEFNHHISLQFNSGGTPPGDSIKEKRKQLKSQTFCSVNNSNSNSSQYAKSKQYSQKIMEEQDKEIDSSSISTKRFLSKINEQTNNISGYNQCQGDYNNDIQFSEKIEQPKSCRTLNKTNEDYLDFKNEDNNGDFLQNKNNDNPQVNVNKISSEQKVKENYKKKDVFQMSEKKSEFNTNNSPNQYGNLFDKQNTLQNYDQQYEKQNSKQSRNSYQSQASQNGLKDSKLSDIILQKLKKRMEEEI